MPTYDYLCADCGLVFEGLVWRNERPGCPACHGKRTEKQFSPPTSNRPAEPVSEECAPEPEVVEETTIKACALPAEGVDGLEQEWRDRRPTPALDRAEQTLRRDAPELWDLERDFERRQAGQLAEIGEKSQRLVKLMERIESLEPLMDEIALRDRELGKLKETVRAVAGELERRTRTLDDVTSEAQGLRARTLEADEDVRQRQFEIEALKQQVDERDHRVEDANHERDTIKAELESRTAALFKRDELIQEADERLAGLCEEIRERDRCVAGANQRNEALRADLEAMQGEVRLRDAAVRELEERVDRLDDQLLTVRAELTQANEALERENQKLTEARASASGDVDRLHSTQSVLAELRPILESLETTLGSDVDQPKAAWPSEGTGIVGSSND